MYFLKCLCLTVSHIIHPSYFTCHCTNQQTRCWNIFIVHTLHERRKLWTWRTTMIQYTWIHEGQRTVQTTWRTTMKQYTWIHEGQRTVQTTLITVKKCKHAYKQYTFTHRLFIRHTHSAKPPAANVTHIVFTLTHSHTDYSSVTPIRPNHPQQMLHI